jgi:SM-20-related protein
MDAPAAVRIMTPYLVQRDFLSVGEHAALLAWALDNEARFAPAGVGGAGVKPGVRRSVSLRDLGPLAAVLKARLKDRAAAFVETLQTAPFAVSHVELELVAHNDGAFYSRHRDTSEGDVAGHAHRVLSGVYYFHREPKGFSGGCLRLHAIRALAADAPGDDGALEVGALDVSPDQNTLVVFPSWAPHEVMPVSCPSGAFADSRFAVNCWLHLRRPAKG